jgi:hypothetical protein
MNIGVDPGAIALAILNYAGGPAGAEIAGAACVVTFLLIVAHVMDRRHGWFTMFGVIMAWSVCYIINTVIAWT